MIVAKTERLILRHLHPHDQEALFRVFGDPVVMQFGDGAQSRTWVRDWINTAITRHYPEWGFGRYAMVERTGQQVIGYCGLFRFPDVNGRVEIEIGYRLARAYWGRGYATEAARAVCDYAFHTLHVPRLIALIDPHNKASIRVAEKLGMIHEGTVLFKGYSHADYIYSLTTPL